MNFLSGLWTRFGGYIMAVVAAIGGIFALYFRGKSAGKEDERNEREQTINKQATEARQEVRNVQNEVASKDDAAVTDELINDWVRSNPNGKGGR